MPKTLSIVLTLLFSVSAFAENLSGFEKRFKLVRDEDNKITHVKMNFLNQKLSLKPYLKQVKDDLKAEIARLRNKSSQPEIEAFLAELAEGSQKSEEVTENIVAIRRSIYNLPNLNVEDVFKQLSSKGVLAKFKNDLQDALNKYSLAVVASTEEPTYFYKRNVTYAVVTKALEFAKKQFGEVPVLNLVTFAIVKIHDLVLEQRLFHQNMLLHYLENADYAVLGMTVTEADKIYSSIYESRIGVLNYRESQKAVKTWEKYGLTKFYASLRLANNKLRRSSRTLSEIKRYNFSFFEAVEEGERLVKNLTHNKHTFSGEMSVAYNYNKPNKVKRFRSLLNLGQVGLGFLPVPNWLKNQADSFIDSYYKEQKILEGALVAHFEMEDNMTMAKNIKAQMINPYVMFE